MSNIGAIAIGRNEGERLLRCLKSLVGELPEGTPIVYVDSGSTDNSIAMAKSLGVKVVELDMSLPFTMARGRNAGLKYLLEHFPNLKYIQFIDGDCEIIPDWVEKAIATLESDEKLAIVCGRRRERFPDASIYNRLAEMEWNTPIGEAKFCGGDATIRITAIKQVNGYNESMICGEEPEMCIRLRQLGWKIWRIDADMTLHDAAMVEFSQWWKRSIRGGWAIAEGVAMHGKSPEQYMVRESFSRWTWGLILPILTLALAWPTFGLSLLLWIGYPILMWKVSRYRQSCGDLPSHARLYSFWCVVGKLPEAIGQVKYWLTRWQNQEAKLIEYKKPTAVSGS